MPPDFPATTSLQPQGFSHTLGVRILCSKIRELCYALMLTIYANYAPQISHYAPEICHYASKQNNFFRSQKHIFTYNSNKTHRKVTKLKNRSKVSPISHACCTAASKMPQCSLGVHHPDATTRPVAFGHCFPIGSRGNCACAIHTGLQNNQIMLA